MPYSPYQPYRRVTPAPQYSRGSQLKPKRHHMKRGFFVLIALIFCFAVFTNASHSGTVVKAKQYSKSQTVCLDPGHGGVDPGATTTDGSITERDINLVVAKQVETNLENQGYQVFMTRTSNSQSLTNHDRYTYCNKQNATILVSIHHNFFTDPTVDYATALFYKDNDQALATSVLGSVADTLNLQNDGISQFEDGVLSESHMPATVSEGFFITSDYEFNQLTTSGSKRLSNEAAAITKGITSYFTQPASKRPAINKDPQVIQRDDTGV